LAATLNARAVVELGTGVGVSGTWLLRGMRNDGVLTTIDTRPEHQQVARETFVAAGYAASRARLIPGRGVDVMTRLADGGYDMVFGDFERRGYVECLDEAIRLLRPHGLLALNDAMPRDRLADPTFRDPETLALRALHRAIREDKRLLPALLPVGEGLLCAVKR
jgi:predicted O-methyltransferase YrrM